MSVGDSGVRTLFSCVISISGRIRAQDSCLVSRLGRRRVCRKLYLEGAVKHESLSCNPFPGSRPLVSRLAYSEDTQSSAASRDGKSIACTLSFRIYLIPIQHRLGSTGCFSVVAERGFAPSFNAAR